MEAKKFNPVMIIHYAVVLFLCFVFPTLKPIGALSPGGMALVGGFLGAVYGWSFINLLWPSFAGLLSLGWFLGFNTVASAGFGNTTVIMLMMMFVILGCLTETGAVSWLLTKMLSMKFFIGHPWVTIGFFFYISYLMAGLNSPVMAMILLPVMSNLFKLLDVKPYTKLPVFIFIGIMYCLLMGQVTFPFLGVSFTLLAAYSAMFQTAMDFTSYLMFTFPLSVIMIMIYILSMRFIFRVDVSPFEKITAETFGETKPATRDQKIAFVLLIFYIIALLGMSLKFLGPLYMIINKLTVLGIAVVALFALLLIQNDKGKPFVNMNTPMSWEIILITSLVMILSAFMNNPDYGITATITMLLKPMMVLPKYVFLVLALALALFLTHFATNMVLCIVFMPFMVTFANTVGMVPTGIVALLFFTCQMSLATPGGGAPVSAIFYGATDWVTTPLMTKYALMLIPILFGCDMLLGLTWASIIF